MATVTAPRTTAPRQNECAAMGFVGARVLEEAVDRLASRVDPLWSVGNS